MRHRAMLLKFADHRVDRGGLLADGDVDTFDARALLVDDSVDGDGGLAGLAVTDDQLTLTTADRDHGVQGFQARLHRLAHRLSGDNTGGDFLDRRGNFATDVAFAVD